MKQMHVGFGNLSFWGGEVLPCDIYITLGTLNPGYVVQGVYLHVCGTDEKYCVTQEVTLPNWLVLMVTAKMVKLAAHLVM